MLSSSEPEFVASLSSAVTPEVKSLSPLSTPKSTLCVEVVEDVTIFPATSCEEIFTVNSVSAAKSEPATFTE
jgi:hypothetical protein